VSSLALLDLSMIVQDLGRGRDGRNEGEEVPPETLHIRDLVEKESLDVFRESNTVVRGGNLLVREDRNPPPFILR
jgi:hypothetical protein